MPTSPTELIACLFLLAGSLLFVGCATDKQVIAQAEGAHGQIEPAILTDPQLDRYTQAVGDRIVATAYDLWQQGAFEDLDLEEWMFEDVSFHMVNSDVPNAFTTGGKHIYMYTGLFTRADTEDGFAAVVGHEFGHILGRHVHGGMNRRYTQLGIAAGAAVAGAAIDKDNRARGASLGAGMGLAGGQVAGLKFGRDDEAQADAIGFALYAHSGYDPNKFREFFAAMVEAGADQSGLQELMSSHPSLSSRVANADRRAEEWKQQNPDWQRYLRPDVAGSEAEFARLQQRAKQLEKSSPQDSTLGQAQALLDAFPRCVDLSDE